MARDARDMRERRGVGQIGLPPRLAPPPCFACLARLSPVVLHATQSLDRAWPPSYSRTCYAVALITNKERVLCLQRESSWGESPSP
jgi:hypothetical protein